jgi:hypothetical protein
MRREAREMFSVRADWRVECEARREGWMVEGEWVRAERRAGVERMVVRSCFLLGEGG